MPEGDSEFVLQVLELYRAIEGYKLEHPEDTDVSYHRWAHFAGFDGNNEGRLLGFTRFLIKVQKKYAEQLAYEKKTDGFNSHRQMLAAYGRMVEAYRMLGNPFPLSRDAVLTVLRATQP